MKKHAIIFASLALSCLVLSAPLSARGRLFQPDRSILALHHYSTAGTACDRAFRAGTDPHWR